MKKLIFLLFLASQVALGQKGLFKVPTSSVVNPPAPSTGVAAADTATTMTVVMTYNQLFTAAPTVTFADLKYNKNLCYVLVKDDGGWVGNQAMAKMYNGGTINGTTYPPLRFSDGTGKQIDWHYTFAFNWNMGQLTNTESVNGHLALWQTGNMGITNHSMTHIGLNDRQYDSEQNQRNIYITFRFRTRTFTLPTAYDGNVANSFYMGYLATASAGYGSSLGASDDYGTMMNQVPKLVGERMVSSIGNKQLVLTRRHQGDGWDNTSLANNTTWVNGAVAAATGTNADNKFVYQAFSHGLSEAGVADTNARNNYYRLLQRIKAGGDPAILDLQESVEYQEAKMNTVRSVTYSGNTATLKISKISKVARFMDMTFMAPPGMTGVSVQGADSSSYNPTTGQINVWRRRTTFTDPATDVTYPKPKAVSWYSADSKTIVATFTTPISQSVLAGYSVYDSPKTFYSSGSIANDWTNRNNDAGSIGTLNPLISMNVVPGTNNTQWEFHVQNDLTTRTVLDYHIQRGNAIDPGTGLKMTSFITWPCVQQPTVRPASGYKTLTLVMYSNEDLAPHSVTINGVDMGNGTQFSYPTGTVLNVTVSVTTSDANKKLTFTNPYKNGVPTSAGKSLSWTVTVNNDVDQDIFLNM